MIDNASTRSAREVLADFPQVDVIRSELNTGGAGGFAFALEVALRFDSDWLWLMDDDAIPQTDALEKLMMAANRLAHNAGVLCSAVLEFNELATMHRRMFSLRTGIETQVSASKYACAELEIDTGSFVGFLVRNTAVASVGLPDKNFFLAYDDTEYSLRLRRAGWQIWLIPDSVINHLRGAGSRLRSSEFGSKHYYNIRNRLVVTSMYAKWKSLARLNGILTGFLIWITSRKSHNCVAWALFRRAINDGLNCRLGKMKD